MRLDKEGGCTMRRMFLVLLTMAFIANLSLAEEVNTNTEEARVQKEDFSVLSTSELEKRLEEANQEIKELETKADYLKTEEPEYFDYSPETVERTGFETQSTPESKLLNPMASKEIKKRLDKLYILKKDIEKELGKREKQ